MIAKLSTLRVCRRITALPPDAAVRIYSIQSSGALRYLEENGVLRCTPEALDEHSDHAGASTYDHRPKQAYDWIADQLRLTTGTRGETYPLWAWLKRPSMTGKERRRYRGESLIVAIVPRRRLLISDHGQWHICLMGGAITISEQEDDHFDDLEKTSDQATWTSLVHSTWQRVFEFSPKPGEQTGWRLCGRAVMQACVDEIRLEEIVRIRQL
jgi:hypothetical protein